MKHILLALAFWLSSVAGALAIYLADCIFWPLGFKKLSAFVNRKFVRLMAIVLCLTISAHATNLLQGTKLYFQNFDSFGIGNSITPTSTVNMVYNTYSGNPSPYSIQAANGTGGNAIKITGVGPNLISSFEYNGLTACTDVYMTVSGSAQSTGGFTQFWSILNGDLTATNG